MIGSPPGDFGAFRHVDLRNWNAPRYFPPPPIAFGSLPDSHSAVWRAQRLSRSDTLSHRRSYLEASAGASSSVEPSPPVDTPPEPADDSAPADDTANADDPASIASAAISKRTILDLGFAVACET